MSDFVFDDPPLPVHPGRLNEQEMAVYQLYRRLAREREEAHQTLAAERRAWEDRLRRSERRLARLASEQCLIHRITREVGAVLVRAGCDDESRSLELLAARFRQSVQESQIEVDCLEDREVDASLDGVIEVVEAIPAPVASSRIAHVLVPLVLSEGRVIQTARVILRIPQSSGGEAETAGGES